MLRSEDSALEVVLRPGKANRNRTGTAREKRGHPARAVDWNDRAIWPSAGQPVPYVLIKTSIISTWKPPSFYATRRPGGGRMLRDKDRPFILGVLCAMLSGCLARVPAWAFCPMTFTFRSSLGRVSAGRRSAIYRPGQSRTIGSTLCRLPTPSSTYSRRGSAISSMSCSGRTDDLRGQSR